MQLDKTQIKNLQQALLDAYRTKSQLEQMVRFQLGKNLETISANSDLNQSVFELIMWAERTDTMLELLHGAIMENPRNNNLISIIDEIQNDLDIQIEYEPEHRYTPSQNDKILSNTISSLGFRYPFGEVACEDEAELLQKDYPRFYYSESRFNSYVLDSDRYLVVGRRGAGKSSLIKYCNFQNRLSDSGCIALEKTELFQALWQKLLESVLPYKNYETLTIANIWSYVIWLLIFDYLQIDVDWCPQLNIDKLNASTFNEGKVSVIIESLLLCENEWNLTDFATWMANLLNSDEFKLHQQEALGITEHNPLIIAVDTAEKYDLQDDIKLQTKSALIECASKLNIVYARQGVHVKVFIASEVYPYIKESVISNPSKFIREPVFLHWTAKDLIRLVTWRFSLYLTKTGQSSRYVPVKVEWNNFEDILDKLWYPFFGEKIIHSASRYENTYPYILRFTQMRPRQLVTICNLIAKQSIDDDVFPHFHKLDIVSMIDNAATALADETINSYSRIYPRVGEIIQALQEAPPRFQGNYLDKVAKKTRSLWPTHQSYSLANFRRIVAELGIVGRVRSYDQHSKIVAANFEYNAEERLALRDDDDCVIHPMFYSKLQMKQDIDLIVYPFPENHEFMNSTAN